MPIFPVSQDIFNLVQIIKDNLASGHLYAPEMLTTHHFSDNIYCRELFIPAASVVVGKKHATRHLNIILRGECYLWTVQEKIHAKQGMIWESLPGVQKVCYAITDVSYLTIHYNPENDISEEVLEGKYIQSKRQLDLFPELNKIPFGNDRRYLK